MAWQTAMRELCGIVGYRNREQGTGFVLLREKEQLPPSGAGVCDVYVYTTYLPFDVNSLTNNLNEPLCSLTPCQCT